MVHRGTACSLASMRTAILLLASACVTQPPTAADDPTTEVTSDVTVLASVGPYFTTPMFFNRDVSAVAKAANAAIDHRGARAAGGWGNGNTMQIDFAIDVLTANASTPMRDVHADRATSTRPTATTSRCRCRPAATSRARPATRAPATATAT